MSKSSSHKITVETINDLLPQTQCQQCNYPGCRPYAEAIVHHREKINLCQPGGVETLIELAKKCGQDPNPFISEMQKNFQPPMVAVIQEENCIGCTKCLNACPTDAIIGASKQMHTIISDACTGCTLCLAPCPVDCIVMQPINIKTAEEKKDDAQKWKNRYQAKQKRLENSNLLEKKHANELDFVDLETKRAEIRNAVLRSRNKNKPLYE